MRRLSNSPISHAFRWIDRSGAVLWASSEYRNARDVDQTPISLSEACGRTIGYGEPAMVGRFCTTPSIGDKRWARFKTDVEKDIIRVDEIRKFLATRRSQRS